VSDTIPKGSQGFTKCFPPTLIALKIGLNNMMQPLKNAEATRNVVIKRISVLLHFNTKYHEKENLYF